MKNRNIFFEKLKACLLSRWSAEEYPGGEKHFQIKLLGQDVGIFILIPAVAVLLFKGCETMTSQPKRQSARDTRQERRPVESDRSQVIDFSGPALKGAGGHGHGGGAGMSRRSPGSLVRLRLLNVVETYSTAPVHAQIVDSGLGQGMMGSTLIGDAVPDTNFERIGITFRFARDSKRDGVAIPISARALSLDGTLGLDATKKEGFFAHSMIGSASSTSQGLEKGSGDTDFKQVLFRALTAGLVQEFGSGAQIEKNRSQVLTLTPSTEFFAELTDFFPGNR